MVRSKHRYLNFTLRYRLFFVHMGVSMNDISKAADRGIFSIRFME